MDKCLPLRALAVAAVLILIPARAPWAVETSADRAFDETMTKVHAAFEENASSRPEKIRFEDRYNENKPAKVQIVDLTYHGAPFLARTPSENYNGAPFEVMDERMMTLCAGLGYGAATSWESEWSEAFAAFNVFDRDGKIRQVAVDATENSKKDEALHLQCLERTKNISGSCQFRASDFIFVVCLKKPKQG